MIKAEIPQLDSRDSPCLCESYCYDGLLDAFVFVFQNIVRCHPTDFIESRVQMKKKMLKEISPVQKIILD